MVYKILKGIMRGSIVYIVMGLAIVTIPSLGVCALPVTESFEGAGYQNTWTETVGSGNTVDEDSTAVSPPACGGTSVLATDTAGTNANAYTIWSNGANSNADNRVRFYLLFNNINTADTTTIDIFSIRGAVNSLTVSFRYTAGFGRHLIYKYYSGGEQSVSTLSTNLNENQWYRVEGRYDSVASAWEFRLDGTTVESGSIGTPRTDSSSLRVGHTSARTHNFYFDLLEWSTTGSWPGPAVCASASGSSLLLGVGK